MTTDPVLKRPNNALEAACGSREPDPEQRFQRLVGLVDTLRDEDAVIEWHWFDENDGQTWPDKGRPVLVLTEWVDQDENEISYRPFFGHYVPISSEEIRFCFHHGRGPEGQEGEDWIHSDQARWWSYMITPIRSGMDQEREERERKLEEGR